MKRSMIAVLSVTAFVLACAASDAMAGWTTFSIRNASDGTAPTIRDVTKNGIAATEFVINKGSMKAAWGTDDMNGKTLAEVQALSITRLDDTSRFTAGSGPATAPYVNFWITNGAGKYAVVANEPSNAEWTAGTRWDMTWDILKSKTLKVFETSDKTWLPKNGVGLTFDDVKDFVIQAPTAAELSTSWAGLGTGAPRELGTNKAYGINWMFGDTLANYVSGNEGYVVANPTVVPEPATLSLLALGGLALLRRKR